MTLWILICESLWSNCYVTVLNVHPCTLATASQFGWPFVFWAFAAAGGLLELKHRPQQSQQKQTRSTIRTVIHPYHYGNPSISIHIDPYQSISRSWITRCSVIKTLNWSVCIVVRHWWFSPPRSEKLLKKSPGILWTGWWATLAPKLGAFQPESAEEGPPLRNWRSRRRKNKEDNKEDSKEDSKEVKELKKKNRELNRWMPMKICEESTCWILFGWLVVTWVVATKESKDIVTGFLKCCKSAVV